MLHAVASISAVRWCTPSQVGNKQRTGLGDCAKIPHGPAVLQIYTVRQSSRTAMTLQDAVDWCRYSGVHSA